MPTVASPPYEPLFLAIDQGGQSSKALVFDRHGRLQAAGATPVGTSRPRPGWVEQDPTDLLKSVTSSLASVVEILGDRVADIQAAGLATQRSSIICWDRVTGEPLSAVISWQDRRGEPLVRGLQEHLQKVSSITGLMLSSHYGASKIRWCLDHLPAVQRALQGQRLVCGPLASYLLFDLCDESPCVVDPAIAARTLLWDLETLDWSPALLELFGVPRAPLPTPVASRHEFGGISLSGTSIPLTTSTGDQSAALFANGSPSSDAVFMNLGTGAFIQRVTTTRPAPGSRLLTSIVWHDGQRATYSLEGAVNGCGSALAKVGSQLGMESTFVIANADNWLASREEPPLFLNGVSGLGSPYWEAEYPTQLVGTGEPWQVMVAVFESILFLLQINLEEMNLRLGPPRKIHLTGGLVALDGLCQRLADLTGLEVARSGEREATARGLACLTADQSRSSRSESEAEYFSPRANPPLTQRYQCWRRELESRLPARAP